MKISDFDYRLPPDLIAQHPAEARDRSRLLVLYRRDGRLEDRLFADLPFYLREGELLVMNDTKVIPARLHGRSEGEAVEILLVRELEQDRWEALFKSLRKARSGRRLVFAPGSFEALIEGRLPNGRVLLRFLYEGDFRTLLDRYGVMPLPPYIRPETRDLRPETRDQRYSTPDALSLQSPVSSFQSLTGERYQTVYAKEEGAIAAPTAGLHFTWSLLEQLKAKGVETAFLTLHVGVGTFRPIRVEEVEQHWMEPERYRIPEETAQAIKAAKAEERRVFAVGTTTVRALEDAAPMLDARTSNIQHPTSNVEGWADLFIYPGYRFKVVDALITNFHLPRSTPLLLVSAFATREQILGAYHHAIERWYRFYSYGDAMLIL